MARSKSPNGPLDVEMTPEHEAVLDAGRAFYDEHLRREQALVVLALEWVRLNPGSRHEMADGTPIESVAGLTGEQYVWLQLGQMGCPLVDDLTIPIFAASIGLSEYMARNLIREAVMLVNFLPRVWQRAQEGAVQMWRARILANECWGLTPEAITEVDRAMSHRTARHTKHGRAEVIKRARMRHMPQQVAQEEARAQERRHVEVSFGQGADQGIGFVSAQLDEFDARALEHALVAGAKAYTAMGSDASLNLRRAWTLGEIARGAHIGSHPQLPAGGLFHGRSDIKDPPVFLPECACARGLHPPGRAAPPTVTNLYLHISPDAFDPASARPHITPPRLTLDGRYLQVDGIHPRKLAISNPYPDSQGTAVPRRPLAAARVQGPGLPPGYVVSSTMVQQWLTRPRFGPPVKITFRPVIDLAEHDHTGAYEVPDRIKERLTLRDRTCVFPWCNRTAIGTDCDHTIAWKPDHTGGPTCSCNLAPLCRTHHRAKTHADNHTATPYTWWNYEHLGLGEYLWTGPKGTIIHRTTDASIEIRPPTPTHKSRHTATSRTTLTKRVITAQKYVTHLTQKIPPPPAPEHAAPTPTPKTRQADR